jgi:hypothetical protein
MNLTFTKCPEGQQAFAFGYYAIITPDETIDGGRPQEMKIYQGNGDLLVTNISPDTLYLKCCFAGYVELQFQRNGIDVVVVVNFEANAN